MHSTFYQEIIRSMKTHMTKAKAPRANIGMAVFGNEKNKNPYENIRENQISMQ